MRVPFSDVERSINRLLDDLGPHAVLSVDIFDTLIHRRCSNEFVKDHVARRLEERLTGLGLTTAGDVAIVRREVESALFDEARAAGADPEFHISDRNARWISLLVGARIDDAAQLELSSWLETVEVDAEIAVCVVNAQMRSSLRRIRERVDRVVFTSDMYLGEGHIRALLDACGFEDVFDAGYVSGDLKLYKATGRMFEHLVRCEGVRPDQVIHVGDNGPADYDGPRSLGIHAVLIDDPVLRERKEREASDHAEARTDPLGLSLAVDRFVHEGLPRPTSFAESYGRSLFGPIFSDFVHQVAVRADLSGIGALFFLSRDGFTFRRMYEEMCQHGWERTVPRIPSRYICLSRLPVLRAMLQDGMSLKALLSAKNHLVPTSRTVTNTFATLGLDPAMVAGLAKRHGVDPADFFHDGLLHWPPFLNLLTDRELARDARRVGDEAANLVRDYLRQEGLFDFDRVGLVDIGWGATIQDQLRDCIMDEPDCPTMVGYYFGGNASMYERRTPDNWMEPVTASVFTDEKVLALGNAATFSFVGLMEEAGRAPHGTCVGYERSDGDVVPVLRPNADRRAEIAAEPVLARLQAGTIDYAREFARAVEFLAPSGEHTRALANTALQRLVFYPDRREVEMWQSVHHTNDLGGILEIDEVLVTPARPRWKRPWRWRRRSRASMWTFGSIRYLLGVPGLFLYQLGWSSSKARHVQADMNSRKLSAPYYFSNENTRPTARRPGKLDESPIFVDSVAAADAYVAENPSEEVAPVRLLSAVHAASATAVVQANRMLPSAVYGGFKVINDGVPLTYLVDRRIKSPLRAALASTYGLLAAAKRVRHIIRWRT